MGWIGAVGERGEEIIQPGPPPPPPPTVTGAFGWNNFDERFDARRLYYVWSERAQMESEVQAQVAAGFYPLISLKPPVAAPAGWQQVAAGTHDAAIASATAELPPCDFCFHHEPENDAPTAHADYRAAFNRVSGLLPDGVRPVVNLMDFTFDPVSGRNPANWLPSTAEAIALDPYNWYGFTTQTWSWPETIMANPLDYLATDSRPILVWETNTNEHATNTTWKAEWWTRFADLCEVEEITQLVAFDAVAGQEFQFRLFTSTQVEDAITEIVARPYWSG